MIFQIMQITYPFLLQHCFCNKFSNKLSDLCPNSSQLKSSLQFSETKKRPLDIMGGKGLSANINKASGLLKWKPKFTTSEALQKTHRWFKKNIHLYE